MAGDVTLVITSCGRQALLQRTLESFRQFNTYPVAECILIEDSGKAGCNEHLQALLPFPVRTLYNPRNLGQIPSVDIAYGYVRTPFIFHCEDDWEFFRAGFIEDSLAILNKDPKVLNVWLRAHDDTNGHPIEDKDRGGYRYMAQHYANCWHGFTFNPGLRRTRNCMRLHPYCDLDVLIPKGKEQLSIHGEVDLSIYFKLLGYRGAITLNEGGYVRHIGDGRHVKLSWD